jgi:hypothetical protein
MLTRIMTRLSTFAEGVSSTSAPTRTTLPAAERLRSTIAQESSDLEWPPRTIDTYDFEKQSIVSYQPAGVPESVPETPPSVLSVYDRTWREIVLERYHGPLEILVIALAIVAVVETPYLFLHFAPSPSRIAQIAAVAPTAKTQSPAETPRSPDQAPAAVPDAPAPVSATTSAAIPDAPVTALVTASTPVLSTPAPAVAERAVTSTGQVKVNERNLGRADAEPTPRARTVAVPTPPAPGWFSLSLPIQLQIFENGRFVGTSDGSHVTLAAGSHDLELVNESVQFRERRSVQIRSGKVTPLSIALPTGRLQVNAIPWSEVLIDGARVGDTPLGNLELPIGPHRIVFRHPELGEQARTAVIGVGALTRLSVDFRK